MAGGVGLQRDIGAIIAGHFGLANVTITSDTTSDNDPQYGPSIDRLNLGRRYLSCKVLVPFQAAVSNGKKASVSAGIQDSGDGSSWADYSTDTEPGATVLGTSATSASSTGGNSAAYHNVDLTRARRYIRMKATADLSASSSSNNNVALAGVVVFAGAEAVPAT